MKPSDITTFAKVQLGILTPLTTDQRIRVALVMVLTQPVVTVEGLTALSTKPLL